MSESILGKNFTSDIYHESFSHLHKEAHKDSVFESEDEQTFDDFLDIGKRKPNAHGTGRWTLNKQRNKLAVFEFVKKGEKGDNHETLAKYLSAFICLPVDFKRINYTIDYERESLQMEGYEETECKVWKERKNKRKKLSSKKEENFDYILDVFSLFDMLTALSLQPYISIVALFNEKLGENDEGGKCCEVLGRGCGDRVSVASIKDCINSKKMFYATVTHELLHTIGFDHCKTYRCLMNAIRCEDDEECIFLSPLNLRKLKEFHKVNDDKGEFVLKRYKKLLPIIKEMSIGFSEFAIDVIWLEEKIKSIEALK